MSAGFAPTRDGAFLPLAAMAGRALAHWLKPEDLELEIARQFAAFQAGFGRTPDYVDGHQHIHVFPQIRGAVLARHSRMPRRRHGCANADAPPPRQRAWPTRRALFSMR